MTLEEFLKPLYQDLDGVNRLAAVERVGAIARQLQPPSRELDLLILFSGLRKWLAKPRNYSRVLLSGTVTKQELDAVIAASLDEPQTDAECAVASALVIDSAGVRGLADRFAQARREGNSIADVANEAPPEIPEWMPAKARAMMLERLEARQRVCRALLDELRS